MGRRIKLTAEEKKVLILECLAGRLRMREAARRAGVGHSTMHFWISRYRSEGRVALAEDGNQSKRNYSPEVRQKAVEENLLDRDFHADRPNEKWLTDVTEFRYYVGPSVRKLYLSAILDLCDRRIVAFALRDTNDNVLVHGTLDRAIAANPDAHPLFHSDRGFQYTTRIFHDRLVAAGMTQSMSRVGKCIDNGPMEGFWGILKRERYYGRRFTSREALVQMICGYIAYYNPSRLQRHLGVHTPLEVHALYAA